MSDLQHLFAALVYSRHNIHMLHWKTTGQHFDNAHSVADGYVSEFNTMIDEVAEMLLSFGYNPLTLQECIDEMANSDTEFVMVDANADYDSSTVFKALNMILMSLIDIYNDVCDNSSLAGDCISKLDEHRYFLRIEGLYKNKRRISK